MADIVKPVEGREEYTYEDWEEEDEVVIAMAGTEERRMEGINAVGSFKNCAGSK